MARPVLLGLALPLTAGCVATRNDLALLQNDLGVMRAESLAADSARARQLALVIESLSQVRDSLALLNERNTRSQADSRENFRSVEQQLLQIQELTGQSQRRLQELRADMERRSQQAAPPLAAPPSAGDSARGVTRPQSTPEAGAATPGPHQLYQLSLDQLRRGSAGAARAGFTELLRAYPESELAADAQFYVAESYAAEGNALAADSAYALVAVRHPASPRAATALYKRAVAAHVAGRTVEARELFDRVVRQYPRSDEAALARDRLRALR